MEKPICSPRNKSNPNPTPAHDLRPFILPQRTDGSFRELATFHLPLLTVRRRHILAISSKLPIIATQYATS